MSSRRSKKKTTWIRHIRESNVNDIAADVESLRMQWSDQLGRHVGYFRRLTTMRPPCFGA